MAGVLKGSHSFTCTPQTSEIGHDSILTILSINNKGPNSQTILGQS